MKAIVLAAGFATRLYPLTRDKAKPLLDVGGRPVLSRLMDRVLELDDLSEVVLVTNRKFHGQLAAWQHDYSPTVPMRLIDDGATDDSNKLGGLGDLALGITAAAAGGDLFAIAGDNLLDFDLRPYAKTFRERRATLVLARRIPGDVPPRRYGEIEIDRSGRVTSFREKPDAPRSDLAATCTYFFPASVREWLDEYLATHDDHDAPGRFLEWLVGREPVYAKRIEGTWFDIGNRETLDAARRAYE